MRVVRCNRGLPSLAQSALHGITRQADLPAVSRAASANDQRKSQLTACKACFAAEVAAECHFSCCPRFSISIIFSERCASAAVVASNRRDRSASQQQIAWTSLVRGRATRNLRAAAGASSSSSAFIANVNAASDLQKAHFAGFRASRFYTAMLRRCLPFLHALRTRNIVVSACCVASTECFISPLVLISRFVFFHASCSPAWICRSVCR